MKQIRWFILFMLLLFCTPASADEFYKYLDEKGDMGYTDDLSKVPENQRVDVQTYTESQSAVEETKEETPAEGRKPKPLATETKIKTEGEKSDLFEIKRNLDQKKVYLDRELQALMKEKEALDDAGGTAKTRAETQKHNEKTVEFNEKFAEFNEKQTAFNAEIEAYNVMLKKKLEQDLENFPKK
jgi:hypothetical protein